eukprot:1978125-Prymnesium_polylepis.1
MRPSRTSRSRSKAHQPQIPAFARLGTAWWLARARVSRVGRAPCCPATPESAPRTIGTRRAPSCALLRPSERALSCTTVSEQRLGRRSDG